MNTSALNLFIVDDNMLTVTDLKYYLQNRFGTGINISTFSDGDSCLKKVDKETNVVILDYFMEGKNGLETLKLIKDINPKTEVIMLSGNDDIGIAIDSFRLGATDYVTKGQGSLKKITKLVYYIITAPIRILGEEFGVSKFVAVLLTTFIALGIITFVAYKLMN
ncbi:MAG: response regulator [Bacteroidetes bacterium]|nr:response regulator [Bacteroidota bacterium]